MALLGVIGLFASGCTTVTLGTSGLLTAFLGGFVGGKEYSPGALVNKVRVQRIEWRCDGDGPWGPVEPKALIDEYTLIKDDDGRWSITAVLTNSPS